MRSYFTKSLLVAMFLTISANANAGGFCYVYKTLNHPGCEGTADQCAYLRTPEGTYGPSDISYLYKIMQDFQINGRCW